MIVTRFDDLADLVLIEIFSYLSCTDVFWAFSSLNKRLTRLLIERNIFRHVDLSSAYHHQFHALLHVLRLNDIETLIINRNASPLQLIRWPYLPRLTKLYLRGVREYNSILIFVLLHAATLNHLTIQPDQLSVTEGLSEKFDHTEHDLYPLLKNILLRYLPALRSLDLGFHSGYGIRYWNINYSQAPLTYLRVTLHETKSLLCIMATRPLFNTLRELHVKIRAGGSDRLFRVSDVNISFSMSNLRIFTFLKGLYRQFDNEWKLIDMLTSYNVMPKLHRAKIIVALTKSNLLEISQSMLFNDARRVDVHYAFILNGNLSHMDLNQYMSIGTRAHRRPIASATFVRGVWTQNLPDYVPSMLFTRDSEDRYYLCYTLPWPFNELTQLSFPEQIMTQLEVLEPSQSTSIFNSSRLLRMNLVNNAMSPILTLPDILSPTRIEELNLFCCDRNIRLKLSLVRHVNLINSLDTLHSCSSISMNIQSIQIAIYQYHIPYEKGNWTALRALYDLPLLRSLRIIMHDTPRCSDDANCQILAQTAISMVDFAFCFRIWTGSFEAGQKSTFYMYRLFIERLRQRIMTISLVHKTDFLIEQDGCGLIMWH